MVLQGAAPLPNPQSQTVKSGALGAGTGKMECDPTLLMSGLDGSGAVYALLPWEVFGDYGVPPGGSEIHRFSQSNCIHLYQKYIYMYIRIYIYIYIYIYM